MVRAIGLWAEAWTVPGTNGGDIAEKKVDWIPVVDGDLFDPLNEVGRGSLHIPGKFENLNLILDPTNDEYSMIRVKRPFGATFGGKTVYSWLPQRFEDIEGDRETLAIGITGPGMESMLDVPILPFDYPAVDAEGRSLNPDWIWGGENLLTTGENRRGEVVSVFTRATSGSFTLTFDTQTTASIAWDATASQIETILEALSNITDVLVTGSGTETDPWSIEFVDPIGNVEDMTYSLGSLSGGDTPRLVLKIESQGVIEAAGWEQSQRIDRGVAHVFGRHDVNSPQIVYDVVDSAEDATWSLWWNGLAPLPTGGPTVYPGVQYRVPVDPGGLYQARVRFFATNTTDIFRFVIRGPMEEPIAAYPSFTTGQAAATANVWEAWEINDIVIPDGITEIIFRFAYVGLGNPTPVRMNVQTGTWFRKGFNPTTPGDIVMTLLNDMTVDHAPGFEAFPFLKYDSFDADNDSNNDPWTETEVSYVAEAGKSMLQVVQDMVTLGTTFKVFDLDGSDVTYDLELIFVDGEDLGPDLPGGDTGPNGETDTNTALVAGANVLPGEVVRSRPVANDIYVQGANGLIVRAEGASIATAGRIGAYISAPELLDIDAVQARADAELANRGITTSLKPTVFESNEESHSAPYYNYGVGWNVRVNFPGLASAGRRIYSIGTNWNGIEPAKFVVDTDRRVFASNAALGMARAVELMWRKFLGRVPRSLGMARPVSAAQGGEPTVVVASSECAAISLLKADLFCIGFNDEQVINQAIGMCEGNGKVRLTEGPFFIEVPDSGVAVDVPAGVWLQGEGSQGGTWLTSSNAGTANSIMIRVACGQISDLQIIASDDIVGLSLNDCGS